MKIRETNTPQYPMTARAGSPVLLMLIVPLLLLMTTTGCGNIVKNNSLRAPLNSTNPQLRPLNATDIPLNVQCSETPSQTQASITVCGAEIGQNSEIGQLDLLVKTDSPYTRTVCFIPALDHSKWGERAPLLDLSTGSLAFWCEPLEDAFVKINFSPTLLERNPPEFNHFDAAYIIDGGDQNAVNQVAGCLRFPNEICTQPFHYLKFR